MENVDNIVENPVTKQCGVALLCIGNNIEDSSFYYAQVNGKTFEYDHKPERGAVDDAYTNAIAEEDIDRQMCIRDRHRTAPVTAGVIVD